MDESLDSLRMKLLQDHELVLYVKVKANAPKTMYKQTLADGTLKLDVAAPPEDGKANKELVRYFEEEFGVDSSNIEILFGQTSPAKRIKITL